MNFVKIIKSFLFVFPLLFSFHLSAQIPEENIVLSLSFDDNLLIDDSTFQHSVINHETSFDTGIHNSGLLLNGENNYLEIAHSSDLEIPNNLTISLWYKHTSQEESNKYYSLVEQSADEFGGHSRYGIWLFGNSQLWSCIEPDACENGSTLCQRCLSFPISFEEGEWYHIVSTYDGNNLKMYVNGELKGEKTYTFTTGISVRSYPLTIGTDVYDGSPVYLKGTLDEIKVLNIAISENQITELYNEFNTASIAENERNTSVLIYPNPTSKTLHLKTNFSVSKVSIYNVQGQLIKEISAENQQQINIDFLSQGYYYLRFSDENNMYSKSFYVK